MDYLDFEIEIGEKEGDVYPVAVVRSNAGEAHALMHNPFAEKDLEDRIAMLESALRAPRVTLSGSLAPVQGDIQQFGRELFDALFTSRIKARYEVSKLDAHIKNKGMRIKLRILAPEMAALPWEFLYDEENCRFLGLSRQTPIVRYLELPDPAEPLFVEEPLSILAMTANPKDWEPLNLEHEKQNVALALKPLEDRGLVRVTWLEGHTWRDLQDAMQDGPWHIFHYIGHGGFDKKRQEGLIALENEDGSAYRLYATQLSGLLADHQPLRLVVLNSCEGAKGSIKGVFSSTAAAIVRRGAPAALAMQYKITDTAAIELSRTFYRVLAKGQPVDMALSEARKAIDLLTDTTVEWGTPVLYMHSPDGLLFKMSDALLHRMEQSEQKVTRRITPAVPSRQDQQRGEQKQTQDVLISARPAEQKQTTQPVLEDTVIAPGRQKAAPITKKIDQSDIDDLDDTLVPDGEQRVSGQSSVQSCPICHTEYRPQALFCSSCGRKLPQTSPSHP